MLVGATRDQTHTQHGKLIYQTMYLNSKTAMPSIPPPPGSPTPNALATVALATVALATVALATVALATVALATVALATDSLATDTCVCHFAALPGPPANVQLHITSNRSLMVTFSEPQQQRNNATITRYKSKSI